MFKDADPAGLEADTTALPVVALPSVGATVTDEVVPVRSLSADLRLDPIFKSTDFRPLLNAFVSCQETPHFYEIFIPDERAARDCAA